MQIYGSGAVGVQLQPSMEYGSVLHSPADSSDRGAGSANAANSSRRAQRAAVNVTSDYMEPIWVADFDDVSDDEVSARPGLMLRTDEPVAGDGHVSSVAARRVQSMRNPSAPSKSERKLVTRAIGKMATPDQSSATPEPRAARDQPPAPLRGEERQQQQPLPPLPPSAQTQGTMPQYALPDAQPQPSAANSGRGSFGSAESRSAKPPAPTARTDATPQTAVAATPSQPHTGPPVLTATGDPAPDQLGGAAAPGPSRPRPIQPVNTVSPPVTPSQTWSTDEVCQWVRSLNLGLYVRHFSEQRITGSQLRSLTNADLIRMGINNESVQVRLLGAIRSLPK